MNLVWLRVFIRVHLNYNPLVFFFHRDGILAEGTSYFETVRKSRVNSERTDVHTSGSNEHDGGGVA